MPTPTDALVTPLRPAPLATVLLAGGASSRMGRPKAWLDWRGVPLLRHLVDLFVAAGARVVVVGARGEALPELPADALRVDDPPAEDGRRGGPLVGLLAGLEALAAAPRPGELAFFSACDGVFLSRAHLDFLRAAVLSDPAIEAALPVDPPDPASGKRFAHPLASAALVAPAVLAARRLRDAGVRRPVALFDALRTRRVDADALPDPRALRTCNTPEEYAAALAERDAEA
ncbi:MAG: NTP transferase domain-containing protein [Nannocystaceae bacterium]